MDESRNWGMLNPVQCCTTSRLSEHPFPNQSQRQGQNILDANIDLWEPTLAAIDGERDPRCLLLAFQLAKLVAQLYEAQPADSIKAAQLEARAVWCIWGRNRINRAGLGVLLASIVVRCGRFHGQKRCAPSLQQPFFVPMSSIYPHAHRMGSKSCLTLFPATFPSHSRRPPTTRTV